MPYGGGVRGGLYHSQSVEAFLAHVPGLKVVTPATPYDTKGLLKSAVRDDDPVVFLEHKRTYRLVRGEVPDGEYTLPIGQAEVKLEGSDVSVITYGLMVHHCIEAARELAAEGIGAEVVDLRTVRPLDGETVLESIRKTGEGPDRPRGHPFGRRRRRGGGDYLRGCLRAPGRPGDAPDRPRRASDAVQPPSRSGVHAGQG